MFLLLSDYFRLVGPVRQKHNQIGNVNNVYLLLVVAALWKIIFNLYKTVLVIILLVYVFIYYYFIYITHDRIYMLVGYSTVCRYFYNLVI